MSLLSFFFSASSINIDFEIGFIIILFLIVLCFKLGIPPFHFWLPGVYSGANYAALFFLAIPVKFVFSYLLFKLFFGLFQIYYYIWGPIFLFLGFLAIIIGSIGLYTENQIKRFLAYSTINHFGNMFLAIGTGNFIGQNAFIIYFLSYIIMNIAFLVFVSSLINSITHRSIYSFSELSTSYFTNTLSQLGFTITLLSMIGLPPFIGFWGKFLVLKALLFIPTSFNFFLVFFVILTSVIAAFSYLNILKTLYITSFKNTQLSNFYPFSLFSIKVMFFLIIIMIFGFLLQFFSFPNIFLDYFILSITLNDFF